MSRSGYSDDCDNIQLWRNAVDRAISGKRGQAFLKEMLAALNALPDHRLIRGDLRDSDGGVCAIGAVGASRGVDMSRINQTDPRAVARAFGISMALAAEIEFMNDEADYYWDAGEETPEARFQRMRRWVESKIE